MNDAEALRLSQENPFVSRAEGRTRCRYCDVEFGRDPKDGHDPDCRWLIAKLHVIDNRLHDDTADGR